MESGERGTFRQIPLYVPYILLKFEIPSRQIHSNVKSYPRRLALLFQAAFPVQMILHVATSVMVSLSLALSLI